MYVTTGVIDINKHKIKLKQNRRKKAEMMIKGKFINKIVAII